jgi:hypothetical protein
MAGYTYRFSYKKELYYILCIVAVVVILLFSFFGPRGYKDMKKARLELQSQRARIDDIQRRNLEHMKYIEALKSNRLEWEKHAREKGYGKEMKSSRRFQKSP